MAESKTFEDFVFEKFMVPGSGILNAECVKADETLVKEIEGMERTSFEGQKAERLMLIFTDGTKLVLNQTRLKATAALLGTDLNTWPGKSVGMRRGSTKYQGRDVDCIDVVAPS